LRDQVGGRVVRPGPRHREVGELGAPLAGVGVQGLVRGRQPTGVVTRPQSAGSVALLVEHELEARVAHRLPGRETGGPGADHGDTARHGAPPRSLWRAPTICATDPGETWTGPRVWR